MNLYPSRAVLRNLKKFDTPWCSVTDDLAEAEIVLPIPGYATRRRVIGKTYEGYVEPYSVAGDEDAWIILGVRLREAAEEPVTPVVGVEVERPMRRSHGGSGRRWPTTYDELMDRLKKIPGVTVERGGSHYLVYREGQQVEALPASTSDHRSLVNACTRLARRGLDVSRLKAVEFSGLGFLAHIHF